MKTRLSLIALAVLAVFFVAAARGCWDPTKPIPWVATATSDDRTEAVLET